MNELELMIVIRDTSDSASLHFMNFVTGLFAFVVASHFVGARLSRLNLRILIGLFSAFSLISGFSAIVRIRMMGVLLEQLSTLPDANLAGLTSSVAILPYAPITISIVLLLAYAGGVAFLLETRRNSRSEAASTAA